MCSTSYNLSWDSYKNNLCHGFSKLQQRQEFVDVTLAADGHLVKAHQNILALASPYLKQLLQTVPCQHPVIFLSHISHTVLAHLLEYIYTGEVQVPNHLLPSFSEAAKKMHLVGLENMSVPSFLGGIRELNSIHPFTVTSINTNEEKAEHIRPKSFAAHITIGGENGEIYVQPATDNRNVVYANENSLTNHTAFINDSQLEETKESEQIFEDHSSLQMFSATNDNALNQNATNYNALNQNATNDNGLNQNATNDNALNQNATNDNALNQNTTNDNALNQNALVNDNCNPTDLEHKSENEPNCEQVTSQKTHPKTRKEMIPPPLYTTSNRGSLQMIYNRFLYYMHFVAFGGKKRRWRCINYRKNRCPAYIDTEDELIACRKNSHNHSFHDGKVLSKARKKDVYTSISQAAERIAVKEAEKKKTITGIAMDEYFDKDVELPLSDENRY